MSGPHRTRRQGGGRLERAPFSLALFFVLATSSFVAAQDGPSIWRDHILPTEVERAWTTVPWIPSLAEGLRFPDAASKPLLLWAMNGHPLGCT